MTRIYDMSRDTSGRLYNDMLDRMLEECPAVSEEDIEGIEIDGASELLRGGRRKDSLAGEIINIVREART